MKNKEMDEIELKEFKQGIQKVINSNFFEERPFFAKKIMREIENINANNDKNSSLKTIYLYVRIALFLFLLLFPALTEAI